MQYDFCCCLLFTKSTRTTTMQLLQYSKWWYPKERSQQKISLKAYYLAIKYIFRYISAFAIMVWPEIQQKNNELNGTRWEIWLSAACCFIHWVPISPLNAEYYRRPLECHRLAGKSMFWKYVFFIEIGLFYPSKSSLFHVWYKASCCNSGHNSGQELFREIAIVSRKP